MQDLGTLFTGASVLAALGYVGYQLRKIPKYIYGQIRKRLVYTVHIEETSSLFYYFESWLFKFRPKSFRNVRAVLRDEIKFPGGTGDVSMQQYSDTFLMKYEGKTLLIDKGREKFENAADIRSAFYNNFKISGWRAKKQIEKLLSEVNEYNKSQIKKTQFVYCNDSAGEWLYVGEVYGKTIDRVFIDGKDDVVNDIQEFVEKEQWYLDRGLFYKRGYCFYGHPGNGKTSLCIAISKKFNRDIYFLNINDLLKDSLLVKATSRVNNNSILVIEDIDRIVENDKVKGKISFSAILNFMDGVFSKHGIITIITTNHIDKIDAALLREGRVDMKLRVDNPEKKITEAYLNLFFDQKVDLNGYQSKFSMSKIQEFCLQNKNNPEEAVESIKNN